MALIVVISCLFPPLPVFSILFPCVWWYCAWRSSPSVCVGVGGTTPFSCHYSSLKCSSHKSLLSQQNLSIYTLFPDDFVIRVCICSKQLLYEELKCCKALKDQGRKGSNKGIEVIRKDVIVVGVPLNTHNNVLLHLILL